MAVNSTKAESKLKIIYKAGVDDETGEAVLSGKTYSRIKADATDENIYTVGSTIADLQTLTLAGVRKIEEYSLYSA